MPPQPTTARPFARIGWLALALVGIACGGPDGEGPPRGALVDVVAGALGAESQTLRAEAIRLAGRASAPDLWALARPAATEDESELVWAAALEVALTRADDEELARALVDQLLEGSLAARRVTLDLVLRGGNPALRRDVLARALRHGQAEFRGYAFRRASTLGQASAALSPEVATAALENDDTVGAALAVEWLARSGVPGALHGVHQRLLGERLEERLAALRVLASTRSLDAWAALRWLRQQGNDEERTLATLALARVGQGDAGEEALRAVREGDGALTHLALRSLAGLPAERVLAALRAHREDTRPEVRAAVLSALVALGLPPGELLPLAGDADPAVRERAALELLSSDVDALHRSVCPDLARRADPRVPLWLLWRHFIELASLELTRSCAPQVAALVTHDDAEVRALAARLHYELAGIGPEDLSRHRADPPVLYALLEASLNEPGPALRPHYREALGHELVSVRVAGAIGLIESAP